MEEESIEQKQLRDHEENVVRNIIDRQMTMSEVERDQILQEYEKQMVKLENSLTLNKLRQKRMLEDKLAAKRKEKMEKLEKKQNTEAKKQRKELAVLEEDEEIDPEEKRQREVALIIKHAEQKIAVLQGENIKLDDEMDEIRAELMQERILALKGQEERLAAKLATLQMSKARELARIEEQQKAINNLQSTMMDDLTDKGVLSNPECQRVIKQHEQDNAKLVAKIESQRQKQEKVLRKRLQERMDQRELILQDKHTQELKTILGTTRSKAAARIQRVAMTHKHLLEMEQFRNRIEKEISQNLEELRRQFEIKKLQIIQERELQFVAGLVRLGQFDKEELLEVLHLLFPAKPEEDIAQIFHTIYQVDEKSPTKKDPEKEKLLGSISSISTLALRVKAIVYDAHHKGEEEVSNLSKSDERRDSISTDSSIAKMKKKKGKKKLTRLKGKNNDPGVRPEPLGGTSASTYDEVDLGRGSRLPPISTNY